MNTDNWLNLQLFSGEGAAEGSGEGAATGETAAPGQQRLLELGVPADKLKKRANRVAGQQTQRQAAAAENVAEEPQRMSWEQIMADPEYNRQMQAVVQQRLRGAKSAEEAMGKLTPALEALARRHGMDTESLDYGALAQLLGKGEAAPRKAAQPDFRQHFEGLTRQAEEMKRTFPGFDLQTELRNPAFARMTSPSVGVSLEDAYYAVHRKELQTAAMQVTAQKTAQKISNAIVSGSHRPSENGTSGQGPSVTTFDYRAMSPAQRKALKDRIRSGEKIYPGGVPPLAMRD